jgi:hypothetical protein
MVIGTLSTTPDRSVVTWKDGKRQVRSLLRKAGIKPVGFFRARRENSREFILGVEGGGTVRASRRVGGDVTIHHAKIVKVSDLSAEDLAAIVAAG